MSKIIFVILFSVAFLFSNNQHLYNAAITYYNDKEYDRSLTILQDLEKKKYNNTLIYFVIGKIYRYKKQPLKSIKYLKKYLQNPSSEENEMYAKINLAYEYNNTDKKVNLDKAIKIADELIDSKYKNLGDVTYAYAVIYNTYGFYLLQRDDNDDGGSVEYYRDTGEYFIKALKQRSELVTIANNLAITYIRIIEKLEQRKTSKNNSVEINKYIQKADRILTDKEYKRFTTGKIQKTRDYFYNQFKKYLHP